MRTQCPHCRAKFNTRNEHGGKKVKCPKCTQPFTIVPLAESTPVEVCTNCGREIGKQEQAFVCDGKIVCGKCNAEFRQENDQPSSAERSEEAILQIRPWVRFWARMIDFSLALSCCLLVIGPDPDAGGFLGDLFIGFIFIVLEAIFLSTWGTTPGKWLLRVTVRDSGGNKLTFKQALNRTMRVVFFGCGCYIPCVSIIPFILSRCRLEKEGATRWDSKPGFVVTHERMGPIRVIGATLYFVCLFLLFVSLALAPA